MADQKTKMRKCSNFGKRKKKEKTKNKNKNKNKKKKSKKGKRGNEEKLKEIEEEKEKERQRLLRRAVHSSHQFFGEVTNQVTNFKSPIFLFQVTKMSYIFSCDKHF